MCGLASCYKEGIATEVDAVKAFEWFKKAADLGHPSAMNLLADCYEKGFGTVKDDGKAFFYYKKAVDSGHTGALPGLAKCYLEGIGVEPDRKKYDELLAEFIMKNNQ